MEIEILKVEDKMIRFSIKGEDYTLGNLLQNAFLADKRVMGAGFYISHPLSKKIIFTIFLKRKTNPSTAKKIIIGNVEKIKRYLLKIKSEMETQIGE